MGAECAHRAYRRPGVGGSLQVEGDKLSLITVYSQPGCGPCVAVKRHLSKAGVGYEVRDVRADPDAAAEVARLGYQGTPVVVAGDMHTHGFRKDWLDQVIDAVQAEDAEGHVDAELSAIEECAA